MKLAEEEVEVDLLNQFPFSVTANFIEHEFVDISGLCNPRGGMGTSLSHFELLNNILHRPLHDAKHCREKPTQEAVVSIRAMQDGFRGDEVWTIYHTLTADCP